MLYICYIYNMSYNVIKAVSKIQRMEKLKSETVEPLSPKNRYIYFICLSSLPSSPSPVPTLTHR